MSKADNYNKYNYDQALGEEHMRQRWYIISGPEVWAWGLDQKSSYEVWVVKFRLEVWIKSEIWYQEIIEK